MSHSDLLVSPLWTSLALAIVALIAWLLAREIAHRRLSFPIDMPGARSSHDRPTPRGGGIGIAISGIVVVAALAWVDAWPTGGAWLVVSAFTLVALIGSIDDFRSQPAALRLAVHLLAALLLLFALQPLVQAQGELTLAFGALVVLLIAWSINLHNFMDGIDTLLAGQAIWCGGVYALLFMLGDDPFMASFSAVLAVAAAGFLPWNWPTARVFMGDGSSGYIGAIVAWLAVYGAIRGIVGWPESMVIASAFLIDSGATVLWRAVRGQAIWRAHKEHLYQRLVLAGASHGRVAAGYMLWNLLIAGPAVYLIRTQASPASAWLIAATVLVAGIVLWWLLRVAAGRRIAGGGVAAQVVPQ